MPESIPGGSTVPILDTPTPVLRRSRVDAGIVLGDASPEPPQRPADGHPAAGRWSSADEPDADAQPGCIPPGTPLPPPFIDPADEPAVTAEREAAAARVARAAEERDRDPGEAQRGQGWPDPPDYGRSRVGRVLDDIDQRIAEELRRTASRMRRERDAAIDLAAREGALRRRVEADLAAALERLAALEHAAGQGVGETPGGAS